MLHPWPSHGIASRAFLELGVPRRALGANPKQDFIVGPLDNSIGNYWPCRDGLLFLTILAIVSHQRALLRRVVALAFGWRRSAATSSNVRPYPSSVARLPVYVSQRV